MGCAEVLAEHLQSQARWREMKAEEWPDDDRNRHAADALDAAAEAVEQLPDDDPRLLKMTEANWFQDDVFTPWDAGKELVRRYGFHRGPASVDSLLDDLAAAAEPQLLDI